MKSLSTIRQNSFQAMDIPLQDFPAPSFAVFVQRSFPAKRTKKDTYFNSYNSNQLRDIHVNKCHTPYCPLLQQQAHQSPFLPRFQSLKKSNK